MFFEKKRIMMPRKLSKIVRIFAKIEYIKTRGPKYDPLVLMYSISENILTILDNFLSIIIQFFQKMSTAMATLVEGAMKPSRAFCSSF